MLTCVGLTNIGAKQVTPGSRRSTARGRSSRSRGPPGAADMEAAILSSGQGSYEAKLRSLSAHEIRHPLRVRTRFTRL